MRTVFFDVDTQLDFLYPAGALYVPGGEHIVSAIATLNHWAAANGIPVVSTMDAHAEDDPEFQSWPPHCVAGTAGQQKPASLLLDKRIVIANRPAPVGIEGAQQILLEKQSVDCFTCVNLPALLDRLVAERYVVYGMVTEICVRNAAMGLLHSGRSVALVTDAVRSLNDQDRGRFLNEFQAAGGTLTSVRQITGA
jgi:nicotinamidase/pyrazinamidase